MRRIAQFHIGRHPFIKGKNFLFMVNFARRPNSILFLLLWKKRLRLTIIHFLFPQAGKSRPHLCHLHSGTKDSLFATLAVQSMK